MSAGGDDAPDDGALGLYHPESGRLRPDVGAVLRPLQRFLGRHGDEVLEVCVNGDGEVWLEHADGAWKRVRDPAITRGWAWQMAKVIANRSARIFTDRLPLLGCQLPGGHRMQLLLGPNVKTGIAIAIRVKRDIRFTLDKFGAPPADIALLKDAVERGMAVLVSGPTSSGKTHFLDELLTFLPASRRVFSIEDVEELTIPVPNKVQIFLSRTQGDTDLTYNDVIDSALRFRPDLILCGELSVHNAAAIYRLLNTGHDGLLMTVHASSPLEAMEAWRRNWELSTNRDGGALVRYMARAIHYIVQLERRPDGKRAIVGIKRPAELSWEAELLGGRGAAA